MIAIAPTDSRTRTAWHESGHLVIGCALGCSPYKATIVPDGTNLGQVFWVGVPDEAAVTMRLAGPLAELTALGIEGDALPPGASGDLEKIDNQLTKIYGRKVKRELTKEYRTGLASARRLLAEYWPAVSHVAAWMLQHAEISGPLVVAIVEQFERKRARA